MKRNTLFAILLLLALIALLAVPVAGQDDGEEGGIIITSTFGSGPDTLSQVYCTGTDCADLLSRMYVDLLVADPERAVIAPNQPGGLATGWEISDDLLTYTFTMREDMVWSDGTPITAADVVLDWELLIDPVVEHPLAYLADVIDSVTVVDDYTVEVVMKDASCEALLDIGSMEVLPAHIYNQFSREELAGADEINIAPPVTSGAFTFGEFRAGELVTLLGNDEYVDSVNGFVAPDGLIQVVAADQTVEVEQFLEGEINILDTPAVNRRADIRAGEGVQVYDYPGNTWDYFAFNTADPSNPLPALEDGNRVDQGLHPVFGEKLVRQAIAHAVNVEEIIQGAVFGEGARMTAHITPGSWAYNNDLPPRAYDPELALEMLAEAGWVPNDDGRLVCQGCAYAEANPEFEGSEFEFDLMTNAGNTRREAVGTIIQDQLDEIGITVNFQTIEFNTLLDLRNTQTFDAVIAGFRAGYPDAPSTVQLFGPAADVPESGFNFTSFYNERFWELEQQALAVPGCSEEDRAPLYHEMQEIMQDEMPYLWLYAQNGFYAAGPDVNGFNPWPSQLWWNVDTWTVDAE